MKSIILIAATAGLLVACDTRVGSSPPEKVTEKETTIVNPPAGEKKVENNTTIVNPGPASATQEKKTTTTTNQ